MRILYRSREESARGNEKRAARIREFVTAHSTSFTQETISAYESGKHYPGVASLLKLSKTFHASCDYILGLSNVRLPEQSISQINKNHILLEKWSKMDSRQRSLALAYMDGLLDMTEKQ